MIYTLTDRIVEGFAWVVVAFYGFVRLWTAHARRKAAREIALQTPDAVKRKQPWWLAWCCAVVGLGLDWRLAFESFGGRNSFYSETVLSKMGLIVVWVAAVAAIAVLSTRASKWREVAIVFALFSFFVYNWLTVDWIVHPR
jgi:hypothetical protein